MRRIDLRSKGRHISMTGQTTSGVKLCEPKWVIVLPWLLPIGCIRSCTATASVFWIMVGSRSLELILIFSVTRQAAISPTFWMKRVQLQHLTVVDRLRGLRLVATARSVRHGHLPCSCVQMKAMRRNPLVGSDSSRLEALARPWLHRTRQNGQRY